MNIYRLIMLVLIFLSSSLADAGVGTVRFNMQSLVVAEGELVGRPYADANIFLDGNHPFGGGQIAARTDGSGQAELILEEGEHTVIFSQWTSSHSVFASQTYTFIVEENQVTEFNQSLVTTKAKIVANADAGWGRALYLTGATELLGNWQRARRMTPFGPGDWSFSADLPLGIEYKIVQAPWIEGVEEISTENVVWEFGDNNEVEFVEFLTNFVAPQF